MRFAILFLAAAAVFAGHAFEWSVPDGDDQRLVVSHDDALRFPRGFKATVRFSCDLTKPAPGGFMNLFCKGNDFQDGYCAMVRSDGNLLVDIKGISAAYRVVPTAFESGREYLLELYVSRTRVRVFVDGVEKGGYAYLGTFDFSNSDSLQLGTLGGYVFHGSLPLVRLEPLESVQIPPGGPKRLLSKAPARQARADILWTRTICQEEGRYIGWPTVCRLKNGEILAVFSGDREEHVCPWGKLQLVRSKDEGETWSAPETIANGPLDDRDAGIVQMPDGTILVTYFTSTAYRSPEIIARSLKPGDAQYWWQRHDEKISEKVRNRELGNFRMLSRDGGHTWTDPERMEGVSQAPHGPSLMNDGSLLQIGRSFRTVGTGADAYEQTVISSWRSTDLGKTWTCLCAEIPATGDENARPQMFHEPNCIQLPDGKIVGLVRYHGEDNCMRETVSTDGGRTWTAMANTGMPGLPPHLIRLADGRLVNVYGRRFVQTTTCGEYACISDDNGKTWDMEHEIVLNPCAFSSDLGYPSSCVLSDGSILTIYYQRPDESVPKPQLMATKWRVTDKIRKPSRSGLSVSIARKGDVSE